MRTAREARRLLQLQGSEQVNAKTTRSLLKDQPQALTYAENVRELLFSCTERYDFMLCMRPDGSTYGHGGQKCHKGTETSEKDEKEVTRKDVMAAAGNFGLEGKRLATASAKLDALNDEEFGFVTSMAADSLRTEISPKTGMFTVEEQGLLVKNEKKLLEGFDDQSKLTGGLKKVSDKEVDAMYDIMSPQMKKTMLPSDVAARAKVDNPNYSAEGMRKDLTKRWMEQEGKDLYTGRKINFFEAELEHIQPLSVAGPGYKGADQIKNFGWIDRNVNQIKGNRTMSNFLDTQVKAYTPAQQQARYDKSYKAKAGKGELKKSAAADAKKVGDQAEFMIKKYGPGGVKYLARELGYSNMTNVVGAGGRARGTDMFGNVQTKYSKGKRGERLENTIIRKAPKWSEADKAKARSLIAQHANVVKNGGNKQASLNNLQSALDKLGPPDP